MVVINIVLSVTYLPRLIVQIARDVRGTKLVREN